MANREWSPSADALPFSGPTPPRYYLAHWWPRVGATLVDGLILAPVYVVLLAIIVSLQLTTITHGPSANGTTPARAQAHGVELGALALAVGLIPVLYAVLLLCRDGEHNGQTWGKQVAGLRVIRNDGEPVDVRTALMREGLVKALPGVVGFYLGLTGFSSLFSLLDDLWPLGDKENRAIHDHVANTHVVQTRTMPAYPPGLPAVPQASGPSLGTPPPASGAGGMPLGEVPFGRSAYLALGEIARDSIGRCWVKATASVWAAPDDVHVVRVSNAPEGLFVSLPATYESLLASSPSETARDQQAGWRRATLSFS